MRTLAAFALALGFALAALAQTEPPAAPAADTTTPEQRDAAWADRLSIAEQRVERSAERVAEAEAALRRARRRHYPRGAGLDALVKELDAAREEQQAAEAELPELLEQARRVGVSPAVLLRFDPESG